MNSIIFRDVLLSMLLGMVALVLLAKFETPKEEELTQAGNLIATITWPAGNTDVDLWLSAPGETTPIGYSNKDGVVWNLLRDDTGLQGSSESLDMNYENAFSRGLPQGEYIINIHAYRITTPLTVKFELASNKNKFLKKVFSESYTFQQQGEELTMVRFNINDKGEIDQSSIHRIPKLLRNAK